MKLLLLRHGNTFAANATPVFCGGVNDLPLTDDGRKQARAWQPLIETFNPTAIFTSPLKRTHEFADLAAPAFRPVIDDRLRELNYGSWTGLNDAEIIARGQGALLQAWRDYSEWPVGVGFTPSREVVTQQIKTLASDLLEHIHPQANVVVVTSNGILRFFLSLDPTAQATITRAGKHGVKTGHGCMLVHEQGRWEILAWNLNPSAMAAYL